MPRDPHGEHLLFRREDGTKLLRDLIEHRRNVFDLHFYGQAAGLNLGGIEKIIHDGIHPGRRYARWFRRA